MSDVRIRIEGDRDSFRPGDSVAGQVEWILDRKPRSVEARLYWRVEGKGDPHVETLGTLPLDAPGQQERRPFQFVLPRGPYSFEGHLLSLTWGVEVVVLPGKSAARAEFAMAPDGHPVRLHAESESEAGDPTAESGERSTPE